MSSGFVAGENATPVVDHTRNAEATPSRTIRLRVASSARITSQALRGIAPRTSRLRDGHYYGVALPATMLMLTLRASPGST